MLEINTLGFLTGTETLTEIEAICRSKGADTSIFDRHLNVTFSHGKLSYSMTFSLREDGISLRLDDCTFGTHVQLNDVEDIVNRMEHIESCPCCQQCWTG